MPLLFQRLIGYVVRFLLFVTRKKIVVRNSELLLDIARPILVVSNHRYSLDHFYLSYVFWKNNTELFPLYFIGKKSFRHPGLLLLWYTGIIPLLYTCAGVLTIEKGLGVERNIQGALEKLKTGNTVVIYPEGMVNKTNSSLLRLSRGAAAIAYRSEVPVLPMYIAYHNETVQIIVGETFFVSESDFIKGTARIREKLMTCAKECA